MDELQSLNHSKWECKYHVVFIPRCRRKTLYAQLRRYLGEVFRKLAEQKESRIDRVIAFQKAASNWPRKASSHPARLNFPRRDPFDPSFCITFRAMWRRMARL
jgi:hypothetical protein